MGSPKSRPILAQLGEDIRRARLLRGMSAAELAVRSGTSASTLARLEKGDAGVAVGTLADVLVALGLQARMADLVDIRTDDVGLALADERLPKRGRSYDARLRAQKRKVAEKQGDDTIDPDGAAF
jgi:transcriptional regulator with XRE-family HTH domain